jgi:hypothetical protein
MKNNKKMRSYPFLMIITLALAGVLPGCQPSNSTSYPTSPPLELLVWTPSPLTETPLPACVDLSDVKLYAVMSSEFSVQVKITGLVPNEDVRAIFSSKSKRGELETIAYGTADKTGAFEYLQRLRGYGIEPEFKNWQIRIIHSRGATCAEIDLP